MKTAKTIIVAMFIAIGLAPIPALGDTCTFDPLSGDTGVWNYDGNWDNCQGNIPGSDDDVIIPDGKTCQIYQADQEALSMDVQAGGTLELTSSTVTLTIWSDSTVDGHVEIESSLLIGDDLTISGDGGDILLASKLVGIIDDDGISAYTLTIESSDPECTGQNHNQECSLVVHGTGHIKVTLQNDAFVVADVEWYCGGSCLLTLEEHPKSGSGFWIAKYGTGGLPFGNGHLIVDVEVSGSANWLVGPGETGGMAIVVQESCTSLTGDVRVLVGTLQVDDDFCTTGDLIFSGAAIDVAAEASAVFGGGCE